MDEPSDGSPCKKVTATHTHTRRHMLVTHGTGVGWGERSFFLSSEMITKRQAPGRQDHRAGPASVWDRLGGRRLPLVRREQQWDSLVVGTEEALGQESLGESRDLDSS